MTIQLAAAARHLAYQSGHTAFSDLPNKSKSSNRKKASYIENILANPNAFSAAVVGDPKMRYVGVDAEGTFVLFHSVAPWIDVGITYYVAVIGDDITGTTRVLLPRDAFDSVNLVILKESEARAASLPVMDVSPTDCLDTTLTETSLTPTRLGFASSAHPHAPIFSIIPKVYPLVPGEIFNLAGHKVVDALPTPGTGGYEVGFLAYCHAMAHAYKYNKGVPMNAAGGDLVASSEWQPPTAPTADTEAGEENDEKPYQILVKIGSRRSDSLITTATVLGPNSAPSISTKDAIDEAIYAKFEDFVSSQEHQDPAPNRPAPQHHADSHIVLADAITKALAKNGDLQRTARASETSATTPSNLMKLKLLGSSKCVGEDGVEYLRLAILRPAFVTSTSIPNKLRRGVAMRNNVENLESGWIDSGHHFAANCDMHSYIFNDVMVTQLLEVNFFWKNIEEDPDMIDKHISVFNFCPADTTSPSYMAMKATDNVIADDELFETDTKKHRSKNRTLFIDGRMRQCEDLVTTLSNVLFTLHYLYVDAEHSCLFIFFKKGVTFFMSQEGRRWCKTAVKDKPWIIHSILVDYHRIFSQFLRNITNNHDVVARAINGEDILASVTIDKAVANATIIFNNITAGVDIGHHSSYDKPSSSFKLFPVGRSTNNNPSDVIARNAQHHFNQRSYTGNANTSSNACNNNFNNSNTIRNNQYRTEGVRDHGGRGTRGGRGGGGGRGPYPNDRPVPPPLSDAEAAALKLHGICVTSTRRLPKFHHIFSRSNGKQACNGAMFLGRYCSLGRACNKYHPPSYNQLPEVDKTALKSWISDTNDVRFAPNNGPSPSE